MSAEVDLDDVLLAPRAVLAWVARVVDAAATFAARGIAPRDVPDESAMLNADGSLTVFVVLPDGSEVSMIVPAEEWAPAQRPA